MNGTPLTQKRKISGLSLIGDSLTLDDHVFIAYYKYSEYTQDAVRILFSSIAKHDDFTQRNHIYPLK